MTGNDVLQTVLTRIADSIDGTVYDSDEELNAWPKKAVMTLKTMELLRPASPATSVTCDGCEKRCHMRVEMLDYSGEPAAFVFCDKLEDVGRVEIPLERLIRWQASGEAVAAMLARKLGIPRPVGANMQERCWTVGMLRHGQRAAQVELHGTSPLAVSLAGHMVRLANLLVFRGASLAVDTRVLEECVQHPMAGGGTEMSAAARGADIAKLAAEIGVKEAAKRKGLSPSRIKQITAAHRRRVTTVNKV